MDSDLGVAVQRLLDLEEIKKLKARYFRLMDTKQWEAMLDLFVPELRTENMSDALDREEGQTGLESVMIGAREFVDLLAGQGPDLVSVHYGYMPEIEFTGPDTAHGIWAMSDYVEWPQAWVRRRGVEERQFGAIGYGHYEEDYTRTEAGWKISRMRVTRLRVDELRAQVNVGVLRNRA